ncbi:Rieske (2Fe-2S) protein [Pseudonocardia lacus]|uniref:Rieske (2Fe-2S) protein n=1 Tax=Pseudonocardia lacus TaxID=2835865 RepID=UPI0027E2229D|nr:Rieske (2Fe-2S) protein [Pseudonocardia lacus]
MSAAEVGSATVTGHRLGPVEQVPVGEGRAFAVAGEQVAVFRLRDGALRATRARCPHAGGPLADGQLDPGAVVCPLHLRAFSFADGTCAEGDRVRVFPARVVDGEIVVEL